MAQQEGCPKEGLSLASSGITKEVGVAGVGLREGRTEVRELVRTDHLDPCRQLQRVRNLFGIYLPSYI